MTGSKGDAMVRPRGSEGGAKVERGWGEYQARVQWRVEKVAQT